jgi:hypothetical protein
MDRATALLLIALTLAAYGVYRASFVFALLVAPGSLVLLVAFALEMVLAIAAAVGVWRRQPWAPTALVLLGAAIAATALLEGFVLGVIGWLYALLIALAAVVVALLLASYVRSGRLDLGLRNPPQG